MIVVSDATPLISLMKIGRRELAGQMGLYLMGTVGMLRVAYRDGLIDGREMCHEA